MRVFTDSERKLLLIIGALLLAGALLRLLPVKYPSNFSQNSVAVSHAPQPVDMNQASLEELMSIPGIGQVIAERIIRYRSEAGPFHHAEELLKIRGIGPKSLAAIRDYITF